MPSNWPAWGADLVRTVVTLAVSWGLGHLIGAILMSRAARWLRGTHDPQALAAVRIVRRRLPWWLLLVGVWISSGYWPLTAEARQLVWQAVFVLVAASVTLAAAAIASRGLDVQQAPNFDGASEWNRLAASLGELAAAYGTALPLPDGQQARRLNDREVEKAADDLAKSADRFKRDLDLSLKKDKAIDKAAREAAVDEADALTQDARKLKSVVGDGRPASGEAQALLDRAARIRTASSGRTLSPAAQTAWRSVESGLDKVGQAFGLAARRP